MTEYNAAGQGGALPYGVTPDDLPQTPAERFYFRRVPGRHRAPRAATRPC